MHTKPLIFGIGSSITIAGIGALLALQGIAGWALAMTGIGLCLLNVVGWVSASGKRPRAIKRLLPHFPTPAPANGSVR